MNPITTIDPKDISTPELHNHLLTAIAPRPIALASTIDSEGNVNLSPFSFFNVFGANPPLLIFSPARRVRDNTIKHTLENVKETKECVINIVTHEIVQQVSLSSTEYGEDVNEFVKAGLTQVPSDLVKAPYAAESKVAFECKVQQVIETGTEGGAGNLVICEVVKLHIHTEVLDKDGKIDTNKLKLVARMGGSYYTKAYGESLFEIPKPIREKGIGFDKLPENILKSTILSGNDLAMLANVESLEEGDYSDDNQIHARAKQMLSHGDIKKAWEVLLKQPLRS